MIALLCLAGFARWFRRRRARRQLEIDGDGETGQEEVETVRLPLPTVVET